jgi:Tfp pilus assembly protein PilE
VRHATYFQRVLLPAYNQYIDGMQNAAARATLQSRMLALTADFERLYARLRFDMRIGQHHLRSAQYNRRMLVQDAEVRVLCTYMLMYRFCMFALLLWLKSLVQANV